MTSIERAVSLPSGRSAANSASRVLGGTIELTPSRSRQGAPQFDLSGQEAPVAGQSATVQRRKNPLQLLQKLSKYPALVLLSEGVATGFGILRTILPNWHLAGNKGSIISAALETVTVASVSFLVIGAGNRHLIHELQEMYGRIGEGTNRFWLKAKLRLSDICAVAATGFLAASMIHEVIDDQKHEQWELRNLKEISTKLFLVLGPLACSLCQDIIERVLEKEHDEVFEKMQLAGERLVEKMRTPFPIAPDLSFPVEVGDSVDLESGNTKMQVAALRLRLHNVIDQRDALVAECDSYFKSLQAAEIERQGVVTKFANMMVKPFAEHSDDNGDSEQARV